MATLEEVTATESLEEIEAVTMVTITETGAETEAGAGAVMIGATGTGIVAAVAGITTTIRDITKTTGAVIIELHAKRTPEDSMAEEEAGGRTEASPMVSVVEEVEGDRNKKV
jgi:hypothetical protein